MSTIFPFQHDKESHKRMQTRLRIQTCALELFGKHGYEETTVEQIATAAGVATMTFFRYFPTKDSVLAGNYKFLIAESFENLPSEGTIIDRIETVVMCVMPPLYEHNKDRLLIILRLTTNTPSLCGLAAQQQKSMIADIARMISASYEDANYFYVESVTTACFGLITAASQRWYEQRGMISIETLLMEAFSALRKEFS
jgi:AcrR family transcriptional regulator